MCKDLKSQLIHSSLKKIKEAVKMRKAYFINREENIAALQKYSLSVTDVFDIIMELSVSDYYKGPENDHDGSDGFIWVFVHPIFECTMYIKLKLFQIDNQEHVKIMSFHEPRE